MPLSHHLPLSRYLCREGSPTAPGTDGRSSPDLSTPRTPRRPKIRRGDRFGRYPGRGVGPGRPLRDRYRRSRRPLRDSLRESCTPWPFSRPPGRSVLRLTSVSSASRRSPRSLRWSVLSVPLRGSGFAALRPRVPFVRHLVVHLRREKRGSGGPESTTESRPDRRGTDGDPNRPARVAIGFVVQVRSPRICPHDPR
jgi:hypothetical protein